MDKSNLIRSQTLSANWSEEVKRFGQIGLASGLAGLGYLGVAAYAVERATRARPGAIPGTPADVGLSFEDVTFFSSYDQIRLSAWLIPGGGPSDGSRAVVLTHGIDMNRWWDGLGPLVSRYHEKGYTVLTLDLRGHGDSAQVPLGFAWSERNDISGAIDFLLARGFSPGAIGLHGFSFGAAAALYAAADRAEVGAVVADSAFADVRLQLKRELRSHGLPPIIMPGVILMARALTGIDLNREPVYRAAARLAPRPAFFIHGRADSRTPFTNSVQLKASALAPLDELWLVDGVEHNQTHTIMPDEYASRTIGFFDRHLSQTELQVESRP